MALLRPSPRSLLALLTAVALTAAGASPAAASPLATHPAAITQGGRTAKDPVQRKRKSGSRAAAPRRTARARPTRTARPAAATVAPVSTAYTAPRSASALSSDLGFMLNSHTRSGLWGAMVVSLTRGDTLFVQNADIRLQPASTMKMYTTLLALDRLGPDYQFSTGVFRDGDVGSDGTLKGNLYLRGDGDPAFSNRFLPGDPNAPVDALARLVAASGIKRVSGDLVGDATGFEPQLIPNGWNPKNLGSAYSAPVSALSINENTLWIAVSPGSGKGAAGVALEPATTAMTVQSTIRTVPGGTGGQVTAYRGRDGNIVARGWIGGRSPTRRYQLVINDPAPYAVGAFRAALGRQGVAVDGASRLAAVPTNADKVTSLASPPLSRVISLMNRESNNHYAELLFRNAARGREHAAPGSAANGNVLLQSLLRDKLSVPTGAVSVQDGSGLSTLDEVTASSMVRLLGYAHKAPWASVFHASLPVAGESETLRGRMRYTPAHGNLHAKTGTTDHVISLGGYVTAADGEVLAFSFIYNGNDRWNARTTIDQMGATLAGFARN